MISTAAVTSKQVVGLVTAALLTLASGGVLVAAKHEKAETLTVSDVAELRTDIRDLRKELADFNTRLGRIEGATGQAPR